MKNFSEYNFHIVALRMSTNQHKKPNELSSDSDEQFKFAPSQRSKRSVATRSLPLTLSGADFINAFLMLTKTFMDLRADP